MGITAPLTELDEAVAALRHVPPHMPPPQYLIRDLQIAGARLNFRPNSRPYLKHISCKAASTEGNVLECGSGLSTLLLALTAARRFREVHSFEHDPVNQKRLQELLDRYRLHHVRVHHTPIRSYGGFDWYDIPDLKLSSCFDLVVCDGPARHLTDSGRYGLFPVMRERLDEQAVVLMDDSHRSIDRTVIRRWRNEHDIHVRQFGRFLQFAEITCL